MKVIIAGGRDYDNYEMVEASISYYLQNVKEPIEILSGRCPVGTKTFTTDDGIDVYGADGLGERCAKKYGYKVIPFPPADRRKVSFYNRNKAMAECGEALIAFHDDKSKGTKMMI